MCPCDGQAMGCCPARQHCVQKSQRDAKGTGTGGERCGRAAQATVVELYEVLPQPLTPAGLLLGSGTNATHSAFQPTPLEARPLAALVLPYPTPCACRTSRARWCEIAFYVGRPVLAAAGTAYTRRWPAAGGCWELARASAAACGASPGRQTQQQLERARGLRARHK